MSRNNLLVITLALGCGKTAAPPPKAEAPAKIHNAQPESALASVTLTEKAEGRLGVKTAPVEKKTIGRGRAISGDVVVPPGKSVSVSAPVAGTVLAVGAGIPRVGTRVRKGQVILKLVALPTAPDLASASIRVDAARTRVGRATQLLKAGAGSQRSVDDAQADLDVAEATVGAARPHAEGKAAERGLALAATQNGILRDVLVGAGQSVAAGALLFQVDDSVAVWVKVAVYAGDLPSIDRGKSIKVRGLSAPAGDPGREAVPVAAPPTGTPDAATTDLYYAIRNDDGLYRPGEKVAVALPLRGTEESLVVPWSAILHDIHGGTWVYEAAGHQYTRRRVEVRFVAGDLAVLARGPSPGTPVVTDGAAEIFGTEFGPGK